MMLLFERTVNGFVSCRSASEESQSFGIALLPKTSQMLEPARVAIKATTRRAWHVT
jgi:hypothetical protein